MSIPYHTSNLAKLPISRSNIETVNRPSRTQHDFSGAAALGILSVSAFAVLRWFQIGSMIQGYIESEQTWGDGRSGLANIYLLFASPPMFIVWCIGVHFLRRSFNNAKPQYQPLWNFLRAASIVMLIPFALWMVFWLWILVAVPFQTMLHQTQG